MVYNLYEVCDSGESIRGLYKMTKHYLNQDHQVGFFSGDNGKSLFKTFEVPMAFQNDFITNFCDTESYLGS